MASGYTVVVYTCVLLLPTTLCQQGNRTCFCETDGYQHTCDFTRLFCSPHDNNCNKENVALGKTVVVSSGYRVQRNATAVGCMANDGITSTNFIQYHRPIANCYHSGDNDFEPFWEVFLGRNYSISEITIYGRESFATRMLNVILSVDNNDCYHFPVGKNASGIRDRTDIVCTPVLRGSRVKLRKPNPGERILIYFYLNICELQVWECPLTSYGEDCKLNCSNCDEGHACDRVTGECHEGSKSGWHSAFCNETCPSGTYGKNCSEGCSQCKNNNCSNEKGACQDGCNPGYTGTFCKELEKAEAQSDKLPLGLIVGVAIGGCALLMLIILIIMLRAARNRLESENEELQGLKKSDEVEFQGGSKGDQTATPQPESPATIKEIKVSDEKMPAKDQGVQEKPKLPIRDASQDESGDTGGTISKESAEESESEDE